jgi:hypothetical protein
MKEEETSMPAGICNVCGERFLNDRQLSWLQEKMDDRRKLEYVVQICPGCRQTGQALTIR